MPARILDKLQQADHCVSGMIKSEKHVCDCRPPFNRNSSFHYVPSASHPVCKVRHAREETNIETKLYLREEEGRGGSTKNGVTKILGGCNGNGTGIRRKRCYIRASLFKNTKRNLKHPCADKTDTVRNRTKNGQSAVSIALRRRFWGFHPQQ